MKEIRMQIFDTWSILAPKLRIASQKLFLDWARVGVDDTH